MGRMCVITHCGRQPVSWAEVAPVLCSVGFLERGGTKVLVDSWHLETWSAPGVLDGLVGITEIRGRFPGLCLSVLGH